jgi:hypothetical protein
LGVVVACGPQKDYVPVQVLGESPIKKQIAACREGVPRTKIIRIEGLAATLCEVTQEKGPEKEATEGPELTSDQTPNNASGSTEIDSDANKNPVLVDYEVVSREVSYGIQRRGDKLMIALQVGLEFPEGTPQLVRRKSAAILYNQCLPYLNQGWKRSLPGGGLEVDVEFVTPRKEIIGRLDQVVKMVGLEGGEFPQFVMSQWPDQGSLAPMGLARAVRGCEDRGAKNLEFKKSCIQSAIDQSNAQFCRSFSNLVRYWVGLSGHGEGLSPVTAGQDCREVMTLPGKADSRLSSEEVMRVLQPVCADLNPGLSEK